MGRMGRWATLCVLSICLAGALAGAQSQSAPTPTAFEVATIKENKSGDSRWVYRMNPGGRFAATSVSLVNLLSIAFSNPYPLSGFLAVNGPDWIRTARFDVVAKANGNPAQERFPAMVRALIEERFHLQLPRETRDRDVFALVMARSDKTSCGDQNYPGKLTSASITMPVLARLLMVWDQDRREIRDETGLTGSFEATLLWTPDRVAPPAIGRKGRLPISD
jgi:uncharacterized protein (TIGR03435 family)